MKLPISRTLLTAIAAGTVALILMFVLLITVLLREHRAKQTVDATQMVSGLISSRIQSNPNPNETDIEDLLREMAGLKIAAVSLDAKGKPVDLYGTPFRIRHTVSGRIHTIVTTSAGPDRQFDTADDISGSADCELEIRRKP